MGDPLARALKNPLRSRLLYEYRRDVTSPSRLAVQLGEPLNLVSYHTNVLARLGCVELVRTVKRRGATEHFYRSQVRPGVEDAQWQRLPTAERRALTLSNLDSLVEEARRAALSSAFDDPGSHLSRMYVELDEPGRVELSRLLRDVVDQVGAIEAAARARSGARLAEHEVVVLAFERASAPELPDRPR
jgi:hypothetical protein